MAKKSKQKHRPSEATPKSLSSEALIQKAQDDFSRQNYRREAVLPLPCLPKSNKQLKGK